MILDAATVVLDIKKPLVVNGQITLQRGKIDFSNSQVPYLSAATLMLSGGVFDLNGNGTIENTAIIAEPGADVELGGNLINTTLSGRIVLSKTPTIYGGLTLDQGDIIIRDMLFIGEQTIGGTGEISVSDFYGESYLQQRDGFGATLTIGSGVTVSHSESGTVGNAAYPLVNNGRFRVDSSSSFLKIRASEFVSTGTLEVQSGELRIEANTSTGALGTVVVTGNGRLSIGSLLNNAGQTLNLDQIGSISLRGGTIQGGTIAGSVGGVVLGTLAPVRSPNVIFAAGTLDNVALGADLRIRDDRHAVAFKNVLTLLDRQITVPIGNELRGVGTATVGGSGTLIVTNGLSGKSYIGGPGVTIGPGVTLRTTSNVSQSGSSATLDFAMNQGAILVGAAHYPTILASGVHNAGSIVVSAGTADFIGSFVNSGHIAHQGGVTRFSTDQWINSGSISVAGGTLIVVGAPASLGSFAVSGGIVDIAGPVTGAQFNQIQLGSGTIRIATNGIVDNTGGSINLVGAGRALVVANGVLRGGHVVAEYFDFGRGTFDGVTVGGIAHMGHNTSIAGDSPSFVNGLGLDNATVSISSNLPSFSTHTMRFHGTQAISGTGVITVQEPSATTFRLHQPSGGALTIGPQVKVNLFNTSLIGNATSSFINEGTIVVNTSSVNFAGSVANEGLIQAQGDLRMQFSLGLSQSGSLAIASASRTKIIGELVNAGLIDLNGKMIIDYQASSPIDDIRQQIALGYADGSWTGTSGITSSNAQLTPGMAIGFGEASTVLGLSGSQTGNFSNFNVDATSLVFQTTYFGDANLDNKVNALDLLALATNWLGSGSWTEGDFNYDGIINARDLGLMANNWIVSAAPSTPLDELNSSVPEPVVPAVLLILAITWPSRTRRRVEHIEPAMQ